MRVPQVEQRPQGQPGQHGDVLVPADLVPRTRAGRPGTGQRHLGVRARDEARIDLEAGGRVCTLPHRHAGLRG